jgi:hypothetical protein
MWMGLIVKEWKKRLTADIREAQTAPDAAAVIAGLKPANVSVEDWDAFVASRQTPEFQVFYKL